MKHAILILLTCLLVRLVVADDGSLVRRLQEKDSVVLLRIDSKKPAKVDIFRCTVERTVWGQTPAEGIVLSFLHFPGCDRLKVGGRYLCAIRHGSGTGYTLIRSDMLRGGREGDLRTCGWEVNSPQATALLKEIGAQHAGGTNSGSAAAANPE